MLNGQNRYMSAAAILAVVALVSVPASPAAEEKPASAAADDPASTVLESRNTVIEEHRRGGEVYMIEVQTRNVGSYVLMDRDGQGHRESRASDVENDVDTAKWSLIRW